ncbi:P-loop ATPase, Sll1717 family [Paractinoplanes deccanensis]|uniref:P-loop ATPase, Sll1717 family n=1 Tax=Paractinoplanes deccanensis TaxID=113561 RepID=UPI001944E06E|nr:NACHT domain-containing protein [Actinoplanes deccanensis]
MTEPLPIRRRELAAILADLEKGRSAGVLLLGVAGSGKTVLVRMLGDDLRRQGRAVFHVDLRDVRQPGEVGARAVEVVAGGSSRRTLQSSSGAPPVTETIEILDGAGGRLERPVLLFDGLDEAIDPAGTASAIDELSRALPRWSFVVSSRPPVAGGLEQFSAFTLTPFTREEATIVLRRLVSSAEIPLSGLPLALSVMESAPLDELRALLERWVDGAVASSPDPARARALLERVALGHVTVRNGNHAEVGDLLRYDRAAGTVSFPHPLIRDIILSRRLREHPFELAELRFGAEDAERDDLLEESFVLWQNVGSILSQRRSIVVGDRGAGKSAIFHKLSAYRDDVEVLPVANPSDLLQRIAGADTHDADTLRAAWLVVVAAVVAAALPEDAPRKLLQEGAELRAAVGLPTRPMGRTKRALRAMARPFGGTTLRFAVGPVNLEAELPSGATPTISTVDVESFLAVTDKILRSEKRRAVVLFDRIDELYKYDRTRQEAVVQGLLQVEGRVSLLDGIDLVVFLRTDLFELYDIQEKNKLVSRRLVLDWSEEDWLQVLVRRVLVNEPLGWVAERLRLPGGGFETRPALGVLFPAEVEGRPIDRWLSDSVRNGNGDVSPRLAVLLLYLAREYAARPREKVTSLPLFSAAAISRAMTEVSELSFSEVVNDFKVASSFVLNCRAGKRTLFSLAEVEGLFEPSEGPVSEQVRLLERLGFLERVVRDTGDGARSMFRVPELYTRCWEAS